MIGTIIAIIIFLIIIAACCGSDNTPQKSTSRTRTARPNYNTRYHSTSYCECPSCGAPYYDGYCEECGYPDVNLGWVGENY